jgi:DNA-binding transcriptional ArsR family regulator
MKPSPMKPSPMKPSPMKPSPTKRGRAPSPDVVFEALGDATRRRILQQLRRRPCSVRAIAEAQPVSRPAISQHLRVLHAAGLVDYRAEGTKNIYYVKPDGLDALRSWLDTFWQDALDAFADFVRES